MNDKMTKLLEEEHQVVRAWIKEWTTFLDEPEHEVVRIILERHICALGTLNDLLNRPGIHRLAASMRNATETEELATPEPLPPGY